METNERKSNLTLILCGIIAILIIILYFKGCKAEPEFAKVEVPEVKGGFTAVKPIHDTIFLTEQVKSKPLTSNDEFLQSEIDRLFKEYNSLDEAFANANDSLQQVIYRQTIQPKTFTHTFDNDTLKAIVSGIVKGEVDRLKLDYTIKKTSINVKLPQTVFRLLAGFETGMTKSFDNLNVKVNLGFQNKKGNIFNIGADTDQRFYVGYTMSVFDIKR